MAKTLYSQSGKIEYGIKKYTVDTEADKEALNLRTTKMGSKCYVIDTKKWYILNSSNQWIPFVDAGGSDGSPFNIKGSVATTDNLPSENNEIGDLYIVRENGSEWVWLTSENAPNGYWEQLGIVIDSELSQDSINPVHNSTIASAQDALRLTATPTAGPSGTMLMSGTWSGATWEEVMAAVLASRLIQVDVANVGKVTLLYNLGSATNASSNAFVYNVGYTLYNVFVELLIVDGNNRFYLTIINAQTNTVNISGTTPTITPAASTVYKCGELTSLTISNPPATGAFGIIFYSGGTATTVVGIDNFTPEANKRYRIDVEDCYATYDSWPYTPTP